MQVNKRDFVKSLIFGSAFLTLPLSTTGTFANAPAASSTRKIPWRNWSGLQECYPSQRVAPKSVDELSEVLRNASGIVRPVASGHSFQALVPTDDTIVSLRNFAGMTSHDSASNQATFGVGTVLSAVGEPLGAVGQALPNMPDVDKQSLGGSFSTATHGTGIDLPAMHDSIVELKLMTAAGDLLTCSQTENAEVFNAARVSLGSLGIMTEVRLQNVPRFKLKRRTWVEPIDELLERAEDLAKENRTFEFFYIPFSGYAAATITNETDEPVTNQPINDDSEIVFELQKMRDRFGWLSVVRTWLIGMALGDIPPEEQVDESWRIFANERPVRFNEMEFHLPQEVALDAVREIRTLIEKQHTEVFFPIEFRYIREDDALLSPFYKRASCSIAIHRYFEEDHRPFFKSAEPIFKKYDGRPHWGKLHTMGSDELSQRYPRWQDFLDIREALDPQGKFLNEHLSHVFG